MSFMFATGIENSIPTIQNGARRVDQYEKCGHYARWREDFDRLQESRINYLRYGAPLHTTHVAPGVYNWDFADETFNDLRRRGVTPIMDLCHFGLPEWLGNFQNTDFPQFFAEYATAFATRFPWVRHYTPVNEMFICAAFSALYGWWNEQTTDHPSFMTAIKNIAKANVLAKQAILKVRPDAVFIQAESMEYFHAETPEAQAHADLMNGVRFLALDLTYSRNLDPLMSAWSKENGLTDQELRFFQENRIPTRNCVLGIDYYITNERYVRADTSTYSSGDLLGLAGVARQYYDRYRLPLMHTETNMRDTPGQEGASVSWLHKQFTALMGLRNSRVPVIGFTWYSLNDQVDWCCALREDNGNVNSLGLYDLDRNIRPVGESYRNLMAAWEPVLNTSVVPFRQAA